MDSYTNNPLLECTNNLKSNYSCRICFEEDTIDNLIYPCKCNGTTKYVHRACINEWRKKNSKNTHCEICKFKYKLIPNTDKSKFFLKYTNTTLRNYIYINLFGYILYVTLVNIDVNHKILSLFFSNINIYNIEYELYFSLSLFVCLLLLILYCIIGSLTINTKVYWINFCEDINKLIFIIFQIILAFFYLYWWLTIILIQNIIITILNLHLLSVKNIISDLEDNILNNQEEL